MTYIYCLLLTLLDTFQRKVVLAKKELRVAYSTLVLASVGGVPPVILAPQLKYLSV